MSKGEEKQQSANLHIQLYNLVFYLFEKRNVLSQRKGGKGCLCWYNMLYYLKWIKKFRILAKCNKVSKTFTKNPAIAIRQNILSHTNGIVISHDLNRGGDCAVIV